MATEYELTFQDYLSILRRRAIYLNGIFVTVMLISVMVAIALPPTYRATGTIMVESQQVSDNVIATTVRSQLDEQINIIKQRIMSRDNLLQLANKHNIFKGNKGALSSSELIDKMRDRIIIEPDNSSTSIRTNRQGQQALAFTLSFEDRHPDVALDVTNDLINLFLDWNVKLRTEGATETTEFLTQEAEKLKTEVDRLEKLIADYKQQNKNALPEQLALRMTMLSRAENDLREVERDLRSTKEEIRTLEVELAAAKHGLGADENSSQSLPALKAELARLSSIYKESHPDIRRLQRKIDAMEKAIDQPASATTTTPTLAVYRIQSKIDSDKARLISLNQQKEMLQHKISENEGAMILTPKVGQGLDVLLRDRDSAQKKFEELRNKRMNAKIAENLESEKKSGRLSVLEPPLLPEKPYKPNRVKIILIGFFLALLSSGGIIMLLETMNQRIRGSEALTHVLGYRPLAIIPYLTIQEDLERKKRILKLAMVTALSVLLVVLLALHFLYIPIDELIIKILARIS